MIKVKMACFNYQGKHCKENLFLNSVYLQHPLSIVVLSQQWLLYCKGCFLSMVLNPTPLHENRNQPCILFILMISASPPQELRATTMRA